MKLIDEMPRNTYLFFRKEVYCACRQQKSRMTKSSLQTDYKLYLREIERMRGPAECN